MIPHAESDPRTESSSIGKTTITQRHVSRAVDEQRGLEHAICDAAWAAAPVQLAADGRTGLADDEIRAAAGHGLIAPGQALPYLETIQRSFGPHDVSGVTAHTGDSAREAAATLGAHAYATGDHVVFASSSPSLSLVAHEAAHVVQQRAGVQLSSAVGQAGDRFEQQADAVAERVVRGESAADLLGAAPAPAAAAVGAVQRAEDTWETVAKGFDLSVCAPDLHKLKNGATKLLTLKNKIEKKGTHMFGDNKALLESAKNLVDVHKAVFDNATGLEGLLPGKSDVTETAGTVTKTAGTVARHTSTAIKAVRVAAAAFDDESFHAFCADPSDPELARKWATDVTTIFTHSGDLIESIPDGIFPGFVIQMWKGLFRAPANYLRAFLALLDAYTGRIDRIGGPDRGAAVRGGTGGDWHGPLSMVYFRAPAELRAFMLAHRTAAGFDLFAVEVAAGKGLLLAQIERDGPPRAKEEWSAVVRVDDPPMPFDIEKRFEE